MPTQIRLTSNSNNGVFDANFKEDIFIPKNSKIALNGFCLESAYKNFEITKLNDKFGYKLENSDNTGQITGTVNFPHLEFREGIYGSKTALGNFFTALLRTMFNQNYISIVPSLTFLASDIDEMNNFYLEPKKTPDMSYNQLQILTNVSYTGGNSGVYKKTTGTDSASFDSYLAYPLPLNRGVGRVYTQLGDMTGGGGNSDAENGTNGICLALVDTEPNDDGSSTFTFSDIKYGVYLNNQSSTYRFIEDGNETDSTISISAIGSNNQNSDFMSIEKEGQTFKIKIYQPAFNGAVGQTLTIATLNINNTTDTYYPVVFFKGDPTTAQARNISGTLDVFYETPETVFDTSLEYGGLQATNLHTPRLLNFDEHTPFRQTLTIDKESTANFLGFEKLQNIAFHNEDNIDAQAPIVGDYEIKFLVSANYHIVVLDNIKLKAYDGFTNSRQNVLAYIPSKEGEEGEIIYEPNNLYYVDLDNREDLRLRNIKARILDKEFNPIFTSGISVFSFLIN